MHKKLLLLFIVCVVVDLALCQNQSVNASTEGLFLHLKRVALERKCSESRQQHRTSEK